MIEAAGHDLICKISSGRERDHTLRNRYMAVRCDVATVTFTRSEYSIEDATRVVVVWNRDSAQ